MCDDVVWWYVGVVVCSVVLVVRCGYDGDGTVLIVCDVF